MESQNQLLQLSEIITHFNRARGICKGWHDKIRHRRDLYNGIHYKNDPKAGEERYTDPTYMNIVDLGVGILMAHEMEWQASGWSPGTVEQKDSSKIEKYLAALVQVNSEREEMFIPYEIIMNFLRDGCACVYGFWDSELHKKQVTVTIPDENSPMLTRQLQTFEEPPARLQVIDPLKMFLIPGGTHRWLHVFRKESLTVYDAEITFHKDIKKFSHLTQIQKMNTKADLIDFWQLGVQTNSLEGTERNVVQNALLYADEFIKPLEVMDGYDDLPYTVGFYKPLGRDKSEEWTQSMIDPLEATIALLEASVNRRSHQLTTFSSMPLVIKSDRVIEVDKAIGSSMQLNKDEDMGFPTWQGNPPDVRDQIDFLRSRAQQSGFSDVMFGSGPSSVSGYALSQLGDQNRIRLEQPVAHLEMFWSSIAKKFLRLTGNFSSGKAIRVYGKLRGSDFTEQIFDLDMANYNVRAVIEPEFPNEKVRKHAMATQVRGVLSESTIMERYLDIKQPDDERKRKLQELAETNQIAVQYGMMKAMQQAASEGDVMAAAVLRQMTMQQASPPPQPPQGGPNPSQPLGTQSSTGQAVPQAAGNLPPGESEADQLQQMAGLSPSMTGQGGV